MEKPKVVVTLTGLSKTMMESSVILAVGYYFAGQVGFIRLEPMPVAPEPAAVVLTLEDKTMLTELFTGEAPKDEHYVPLWHKMEALCVESREYQQQLIEALKRNARATDRMSDRIIQQQHPVIGKDAQYIQRPRPWWEFWKS